METFQLLTTFYKRAAGAEVRALLPSGLPATSARPSPPPVPAAAPGSGGWERCRGRSPQHRPARPPWPLTPPLPGPAQTAPSGALPETALPRNVCLLLQHQPQKKNQHPKPR